MKEIGTYTVGRLIDELQEYDPMLPVGVLTFDEDDNSDGPCFMLRPELFIYMFGHAHYLGIAGYKSKATDEEDG